MSVENYVGIYWQSTSAKMSSVPGYLNKIGRTTITSGQALAYTDDGMEIKQSPAFSGTSQRLIQPYSPAIRFEGNETETNLE